MDIKKFNYNKDRNIVYDDNNNEYIIGKEYNINGLIYTFSVYLKKNGVYSIYSRKKNIINNNKICVASVFKKIKLVSKDKLILIDTFINNLPK